jgi:hypothetical protein
LARVAAIREHAEDARDREAAEDAEDAEDGWAAATAIPEAATSPAATALAPARTRMSAEDRARGGDPASLGRLPPDDGTVVDARAGGIPGLGGGHDGGHD